MTRPLGLAVLVLGAAQPALAQGWSFDAQASVAASAIEDDGPLAPGAKGVLADASVTIERSDFLENGVELVWRGQARVQRNAPSRPRFAAALGGCDALVAGCPSASGLSPVSPATGIAAGGAAFDDAFVAALESASLSVIGSWGEGVVGLDSGVAARLDARAPRVLDAVSAFSPALDPTGLVMTRARNDVTGSSLKASYLSPRWVGVRLGVSYAPEADHRGADFDTRPKGPGLARAELENVWEGALSFSRRFPQSGMRLRAGLTATHAQSASPALEFGDYFAWGAGVEIEQGAWTGGVRWLSSDNAWRAGGGDYEALELGLVRQGENWRIGVEAGWAKDELNATEGKSLLIGVQRRVGEGVKLGAAWMTADADFPVAGAPVGHTNVRNEGLVIELSVRK